MIIPEDGDGAGFPDAYIPIAGNYINYNGHTLDPTISRLRNVDSDREGVRVALHGGNHPFDDKKGEKQQAVIDFVCDPERSGLEGQEGDKGKGKGKRAEKADDNDDSDENNEGNDKSKDGSSLRFISYGHEDGTDSDVLRLEWLTKYACEDFEGDDDNKSNSWGFFTWFIILCVFPDSRFIFVVRTLLTNCPKIQIIPRCLRIPGLRFLAELQPLWCPRLGHAPPRRHTPRPPIPHEGLG